jgi:hypothetical protein
MNDQLYGHKVEIPEEVLGYLDDCFNHIQNANDSIDGYRRNIDLRNKKQMSYQQLKRMKNWFDTYNGDKTDAPFILNGADYMKNWVNNTLTQLRNQTVSFGDEYKPEYIIEPSNDFQNIENLNRPSKSHRKTIEKYDSAVTESLKRINQIMKKLI